MKADIHSSRTPNKPSESLIEGIFPTQPTRVRIPTRDFKPWHKPRKQLIRIHQWQSEINSLIEKINFDGRPLRYISLPGDDFLDVRTLYSVCENHNLQLRFLGFNDRANPDIQNPLVDPTVNEITSLRLIDERSLLAPDRFENLYRSESMASKYVDDTGPFDILNLDLCQSFSNPRQRRSNATIPTTYDALLSLIQRQTAQRTEPWLFFLTTRCAPDNVYMDDLKKFWDCIEDNLNNHQEFSDLFNQLVNGKGRNELMSSDIDDNEHRQSFTNTYCVGLGKWLLQTAQSGSPKWKVKLLKSYHYRVRNPYDMLAVAFRFERLVTPPYDARGLSEMSTPVIEDFASEKVCAIEILKVTSDLQDADLILQSDQKLRDEMILGQSKLLNKAGYSEELYLEWLANENLL